MAVPCNTDNQWRGIYDAQQALNPQPSTPEIFTKADAGVGCCVMTSQNHAATCGKWKRLTSLALVLQVGSERLSPDSTWSLDTLREDKALGLACDLLTVRQFVDQTFRKTIWLMILLGE